ncbi:MAG: hypothetical protein GXY74_09625 [Phycisphaerae bacterium]|nr:hypothetical protein [Phycisphaerae bacterium]
MLTVAGEPTTRSLRRATAFYGFLLAAVAIFSFVHIYRYVQAPLVYHQATRLPSRVDAKAKTVADFLVYPGGAVDGLADLLSDQYHRAVPGAVILAALVVLVVAAAAVLSATLGLSRRAARLLLPAVLLMVLLNQYVDPTTFALSLAGVFLGIAAYHGLADQSPRRRGAAFVVLSALVYYLVGEYYLLFASACGLFELLRRRWVLGAVGMAAAVGLPFAGDVWLFPLARYIHAVPDSWAARFLPLYHSPWTGWQPFVAEWQAGDRPVELGLSLLAQCYVTSTGAALLITVFLLVLVVAARRSRAEPRPNASRDDRPSGNPRWARVRRIAPQAILVLVLAILPTANFSPQRRSQLRIDYCAENRLWQDVLAEAPHCFDLYDTALGATVNRALYHLGLLNEAMFRYPQQIDTLALGDYLKDGGDPQLLAQLYFQLGRFNEAERFCHESIETFGERPAVLYLAARLNIAKRRPEAAKVFLRRVRRYGRYRQDADDLLRRLDADPMLESDPRVTRLRELALKDDFAIGNQVLYADERWLRPLEANPSNREAYEYLMAFFLVSRQLDPLIARLGRAGDFGYATLPRHWEEALVLRDALAEAETPSPWRSHVTPPVAAEVQRFLVAYRAAREAYPLDAHAQARALAAQYGAGYCYYFFFGPGGLAYPQGGQ